MSEFKKGYTLIEILIVMVFIISIFSLSLPILSSFKIKNPEDKDVEKIEGILDQIRYLRLMGEENIFINCYDKKLVLKTDVIVDEVDLQHLKCNIDMRVVDNLSINFSSTTVNINKYGFISFAKSI